MTIARTRIALAAMGLFTVVASAGPLNPPMGPVTPTAKPLVEVEPRVAINAENTPGDADSLFRISAPGSYYLTGNIVASGGINVLEIAASDVSVDLSGFTIDGANLITGVGVIANGLVTNIAVRNGSVVRCRFDGVNLNLASTIVMERVSLVGNGGSGAFLGNSAMVRDCVAVSNAEAGFVAGGQAVIVNCVVRSNVGTGIVTGNGAVVSECTARQNSFNGIQTGRGCTLTRCTAFQNSGDGLIAQGASTVIENAVTESGTNGIRVSSDSYVANNTVTSSGLSVAGSAGILVNGNFSRIDSNRVSAAPVGVAVTGQLNFVIRNTVRATTPFDIAQGNRFGMVVGAGGTTQAGFTGSVASSNLGTTDPWANWSY